MTKTRIKDQRRVNDFYARKARQENFPARSVYKLQEVDEKYGLLRPCFRVLDLGCAPGSWTMYAAGRVGPTGRVVGLDLNPAEARTGGAVTVLEADVFALTPESLPGALVEAGPFDVVLSDMAPKTTGQRSVDQARSLRLCQAALDLARAVLKPGGAFLFKIFQGPDADEFCRETADFFDVFRRIKPKSSRSFSPEIFGLGLKFRPKHIAGTGAGEGGAGHVGP